MSSSTAAAVPAYRATSASPSSSSSRKAAKSSATASATSSRSRSFDPFYGHEETAVMAARFITHLFQCPNIPAATAPGAPTPTLAHFVAYALHRTRLPSIVTFAALLLLQRLKKRYPAARGSSGHRLFISAFMISSKVICDDTYSNQSWSIVAQKMFALKEINQMEREMCGYLEWNLNVGGEEVTEFESRIRSEHGPRAVAKASSSSSSSDSYTSIARSYPTPETTPDPTTRPIRPVPSPYKGGRTYVQQPAFLSPPESPEHHASPHFTSSAESSLASSPASDDCKTPSPITVTSTHSSSRPSKGFDMTRAFESRSRSHAVHVPVPLTGEPIHVGGW
ncbi:alternative cyclin Pcl12 [Kwoniella heveanensis CBS 569]|uniref:Alternative cyclin Pcl12 n=1 Tax=Kwoniella heveanensis BCC8398 TaxID=1296120 RepID=A0A1B9H0P7_9TREE|nr:alternative cyclin Pcl12 [Kwoniella heveanensis BCC8398]OCF42884.1 alternative cyclin Pcl12 [Kwoniella heveanensis CBS 569]